MRNVETSFCDITRRIEFDAGHRIPSHSSKCRNVHGHRYVLLVTVRGKVQTTLGNTDDGMVTDFGDLKTIVMSCVGEPWDHAFLCYKGDHEMVDALSILGPNHKHVLLGFIPTAENLAKHAYELIEAELACLPSKTFELKRVTLFETPNCSAVYPE